VGVPAESVGGAVAGSLLRSQPRSIAGRRAGTGGAQPSTSSVRPGRQISWMMWFLLRALTLPNQYASGSMTTSSATHPMSDAATPPWR